MTRNAIIISGQPRNVIENFPNIQRYILEPNNYPDIFIHSWINDEIFNTQFFSPWIEYTRLDSNHKICFSEYQHHKYIPVSEKIPVDIGNIILELYKPKKYYFEAPVKFEFDQEFYSLIPISKQEIDKRLPDTLSMYYSTYVSNLLKQEYELEIGYQYDYVMKIRFDLAFCNEFIFSQYPSDQLTYSDHHWKHEICFTNMWALSNSQIMNCYSETYVTLKDNIRKKRISFTDECLLGIHIDDCGITKNPINFLTRIMRLKDVYI